MDQQYQELLFYTLSHGGKEFIHQHVVDAFAAQTADENSKPVTVFFALAGLYLSIEKGYTGREVQLAHMRMAKKGKQYPLFTLPEERGKITFRQVMEASPGIQRDAMIHQWCQEIWSSYQEQQARVQEATDLWLE